MIFHHLLVFFNKQVFFFRIMLGIFSLFSFYFQKLITNFYFLLNVKRYFSRSKIKRNQFLDFARTEKNPWLSTSTCVRFSFFFKLSLMISKSFSSRACFILLSFNRIVGSFSPLTV